MNAADVNALFEDYLETFAALGRGERADLDALLDYYAVPLLFTTDEAVLVLATEGDVLGALRRQVDALRSAGYDRSETLSFDVSLINARTALLSATLVRRRSDGAEIGRLAATYLVTDDDPGPRIAALMIQPR